MPQTPSWVRERGSPQASRLGLAGERGPPRRADPTPGLSMTCSLPRPCCCPPAGCWLHCPRGGRGGPEAGTHQSREARPQLHDGHAAHQTGKAPPSTRERGAADPGRGGAPAQTLPQPREWASAGPVSPSGPRRQLASCWVICLMPRGNRPLAERRPNTPPGRRRQVRTALGMCLNPALLKQIVNARPQGIAVGPAFPSRLTVQLRPSGSPINGRPLSPRGSGPGGCPVQRSLARRARHPPESSGKERPI